MPHILSPLATFVTTTEHLVRPMPSLDGLRLGVLNNQKANATELIEDLIAELSAHARPASVSFRTKSPPSPASPADLEALARDSDLVVIGTAD